MPRGSGLIDIIKDPIGYSKELFRDIPSKLNNISKNTLGEYGNEIITSLFVCRTPLNKTLESGINTISLGYFQKLKDKYNYDQMFHLSLLVNNAVVVEKNEVVTIEPKSSSKSLKSNTEYFSIRLPNNTLTLNVLVDNTIKYMGDLRFYDYKSFENNCQNFIGSVLLANNMMSQSSDDFIYQDVSGMKKDFDNSAYSYVPKVLNTITKAGSLFSRLIGKGKKGKSNKDKIDKMFDHIQKNGFKFL